MVEMTKDLPMMWPELWLAAWSLVLFGLAPFLPARRRVLNAWLAVAGIAVALALSALMLGRPSRAIFLGTYAVDDFAVFFKLALLGAVLLVLLGSLDFFRGHDYEAFVPPLLLLAADAMIVLAASNDLVLIALFLQLTIVVSYILVGLDKRRAKANEAALKLFLYAATASAVMLYGMSLLYGVTGQLGLAEIAGGVAGASPAVLVAGLALTLAGYGFEVTMVPFYQWGPDAFEGAATPVAMFLSVGPKGAGLAVIARTVLVALPHGAAHWELLLAVLAALTMTAGNVGALRQENIKRLLAYSSIAQMGYLLMGIAVAAKEPLALPALLFYFASYVLMQVGAFAVATAVEAGAGAVTVGGYAGLGRRAPWLALAMTLCLLSLAGIPPLAGFFGKTILFGVAVGGGYAWLAVVAAFNTALSLYYYVRVIAAMFLRPPPKPDRVATPATLSATIGLVTAAVLLFGIFPEPLMRLARSTAALFLGSSHV